MNEERNNMEEWLQIYSVLPQRIFIEVRTIYVVFSNKNQVFYSFFGYRGNTVNLQPFLQKKQNLHTQI